MRSLIYYPLWFFKTRFLRMKIPLQFIMNITSRCNLKCRHCNILATEYEKPDVRTKIILKEMKRLYKKGTRVVWFSGGEPKLWRGYFKDRQIGVEWLIKRAKKMGYFKTILISNG